MLRLRTVATAVPLALMAAAADIAAGMAAVSAALPGALQRVYLRSIFADFGRALSGYLGLLFRGLGQMAWFLLLEGACAALALIAFPLGEALASDAGLSNYSWTSIPYNGVEPVGWWPLAALVELLLAAAVCAGTLSARWLLARASVRLAARSFDEALIEDR
jgi:hypothetical protein